MNIYPLRDYSENDVVPFFALDRTGLKGMPVSIQGSGFYSTQRLNIKQNLSDYAATVGVYSPRFEVVSKITPTVSGNKPFGITLYDTREQNLWGESLLRDPVRQKEMLAVLSGEAVPVLRKGRVLVGPWGTGVAPQAGNFVGVYGTGDWGILTSKTGLYATGVGGTQIPYELPVFGEVLGPKDANSYIMVDVNCYL